MVEDGMGFSHQSPEGGLSLIGAPPLIVVLWTDMQTWTWEFVEILTLLFSQ